MKYLKRFNESNVSDLSVRDDCKDILLELEDKGFRTNVHAHFSTTKEPNKNWVTFYFSRKEEFDYSDIEDVVERLKSYLSEYGLSIQWIGPKEYKEQKPTISSTVIMNPMTFTPHRTEFKCELHFS